MIYENEELRLKTININAEIERGQSDIKKLRRENELLKKEIWCLRDEYEKLDKLLKEKDVDFSSSTATSDSDSCSSCTDESEEVESSQNIANVQKTNIKNLHVEFDHLSVVPEENSTENSDKTSTRTSLPAIDDINVIKPDQSYPALPTVQHFFSPLSSPKAEEVYPPFYGEKCFETFQVPLMKTSSDVIVKMDNYNFLEQERAGSFSNGGNLEELLNDIETISQDILKISTPEDVGKINGDDGGKVPFKTELNVVLMPTAMPLLGFEKYDNLKASRESLRQRAIEPDVFYTSDQFPPLPFISLTPDVGDSPKMGFRYNEFQKQGDYMLKDANSFCSKSDDGCYGEEQKQHEDFLKPSTPQMGKRDEAYNSRSNLIEPASSGHVSSENEENLKFNASSLSESSEQRTPKLSMRRKVSIHFKGKKDKKKEDDVVKSEDSKILHKKTPSLDSKKSADDIITKEKKRSSLEAKSSGSERNSQNIDKLKSTRKSSSTSPDRKPPHTHHKDHKKHKKVDKHRQRRSTVSAENFLNPRERSFSVCTDRSNILEHPNRNHPVDDYLTSDRERTNSVSSCGSIRVRKMSNMSNFPAGKIPWCGCWGNGCL